MLEHFVLFKYGMWGFGMRNGHFELVFIDFLQPISSFTMGNACVWAKIDSTLLFQREKRDLRLNYKASAAQCSEGRTTFLHYSIKHFFR